MREGEDGRTTSLREARGRGNELGNASRQRTKKPITITHDDKAQGSAKEALTQRSTVGCVCVCVCVLVCLCACIFALLQKVAAETPAGSGEALSLVL